MTARCGRRLWAQAAIGRLSIALLLVCQTPAWSTGSLWAQDIEALAELRGLTLPQSYYDRVAQDRGAFELPNGLFRVNAQGQVEPVRDIGRVQRPVVLPALTPAPVEPPSPRERDPASPLPGPPPVPPASRRAPAVGTAPKLRAPVVEFLQSTGAALSFRPAP